MTPFQPELSAKAPCTSTTVREAPAGVAPGVAAVMGDSSWVVTTDALSSDLAVRAAARDIPRPAAATAPAALAPASRPMAERRDTEAAESGSRFRVMMSPLSIFDERGTSHGGNC